MSVMGRYRPSSCVQTPYYYHNAKHPCSKPCAWKPKKTTCKCMTRLALQRGSTTASVIAHSLQATPYWYSRQVNMSCQPKLPATSHRHRRINAMQWLDSPQVPNVPAQKAQQPSRGMAPPAPSQNHRQSPARQRDGQGRPGPTRALVGKFPLSVPPCHSSCRGIETFLLTSINITL